MTFLTGKIKQSYLCCHSDTAEIHILCHKNEKLK